MKVWNLILLVLFCLVFASCPNPNGNGTENGDNNGNNNGNGNQTLHKLSIGFLSNFFIDIGDATALGISKKSIEQSSRSSRAAFDIEEIIEKKYLVKITSDISHGNIEIDESRMINVTFIKKTTIDYDILIPVYDNDGNPVYLLDEKGNKVLDEDGEPIIETRIFDEQEITQDEIHAQINRLYVYNNYTFIQFVPDETSKVTDTRPSDLGNQDLDGYYEYDKRDYYNDDIHRSFIIENRTGNIYSLYDSLHIESIHNGLLKLKDSTFIYDCRINISLI